MTRDASVISLLSNPADFFETWSTGTRLRWASSVLGAVLILEFGQNLLPAWKVASAYRGETGLMGIALDPGMFGLGFWPSEVLTTTLTVVPFFVVWLLFYLGVIHLGGALLGHRGRLRESVGVLAWGYVPRAIEKVLSTAIDVIVLYDVSAPGDPLQIRDFQRAFDVHPLQDAFTWTGWLFLVWMGFLWTMGLRTVHGLSWRRSVLVGFGTVVAGLLAEPYLSEIATIPIETLYALA